MQAEFAKKRKNHPAVSASSSRDPPLARILPAIENLARKMEEFCAGKERFASTRPTTADCVVHFPCLNGKTRTQKKDLGPWRATVMC